MRRAEPACAGAAGWQIECVDSLSGMERIRAAWQELEERAADPLTYFQSYDWCRNWCSYYAPEGGGALIRVYTGYLAGRLAAIWPLMLTGDRPAVRKMVTLTEPHGQYGNILIDRDVACPKSIADLIARCMWMITNEDRTDSIHMESVLESALPHEVSSHLLAVQVGLNSSVDLTQFGGCFEAYRASLKSKTRRARNKRRNRLAALGMMGYTVHFGGTPNYSQLVRIGLAMKRDWLEQTGRATRALNMPHVPEFLGALSGERGAVAAALTLNGRPIAVEIGFLHYRRFYSYLGSFDWSLRDYSPGKLQLEEAVRWCLANGVRTYDLLGEPGAYKSDWCNDTEPLMAYRAANTIYGHAYLKVWRDGARPILKRSFERIPLALRSRLIPMIEKRRDAVRVMAPAE